jgi:hypothetical protein
MPPSTSTGGPSPTIWMVSGVESQLNVTPEPVHGLGSAVLTLTAI